MPIRSAQRTACRLEDERTAQALSVTYAARSSGEAGSPHRSVTSSSSALTGSPWNNRFHKERRAARPRRTLSAVILPPFPLRARRTPRRHWKQYSALSPRCRMLRRPCWSPQSAAVDFPQEEGGSHVDVQLPRQRDCAPGVRARRRSSVSRVRERSGAHRTALLAGRIPGRCPPLGPPSRRSHRSLAEGDGVVDVGRSSQLHRASCSVTRAPTGNGIRTAPRRASSLLRPISDTAVGSAALAIALAFLFQETPAHVVSCWTASWNEPALSFMRRNGFHEAGRRPRGGVHAGVFYSDVAFDLLRPEWLALKEGRHVA